MKKEPKKLNSLILSTIGIRLSIQDLSSTEYKKTWIELQKLKKHIKIFKVIISYIPENEEFMMSIFTLFKSEDLYSVEIPSSIFEKVKEGSKFRISNKEALIDILLFIEKGYKIILYINDFPKEKSKFSQFKKIKIQLEERMSMISLLKM